MFDVFVSYKSEEREHARHVKNILQANGLSCWMDQDEIRVGRNYKEEIEKEMPNCKAFILLISYSSQMSDEVVAEYRLAKKCGLAIFPIKIGECTISDYYLEELSHTQIALEYWKDEYEKHKILSSIRDDIYKIKGLPVETEETLLNKRVLNYQKAIQECYDSLVANWNDTIKEAIGRCGFHTPEPHFIRGKTLEAVKQYFDLVNIYIHDITHIYSIWDDEVKMGYLNAFVKFVIERDLVSKVWLPYNEFEPLVLERHIYLNKDQYDEPYILRIYKDYISALDCEGIVHPVVNLCQKLYEEDKAKYELFMSDIQKENPSTFIDTMSLPVFVKPEFIGQEFANISSQTYIVTRRAVFKAEDFTRPTWLDFLRRFKCDIFIKELQTGAREATIVSFSKENAFFTSDEKLNYMYLYLIEKWIEKRQPENVKILLRNFDEFRWELYVKNPKMEIDRLKAFYLCCMKENGYEEEYARTLWHEA